MKALRYERSLPRFAASRVASALRAGAGASVGPLHLVDDEEPAAPGPEWLRIRPRLSGICGSDLTTTEGRSSRYFEPIVSFPFVPGHEVVGDLDDETRVVIEPVLGCAARSIRPVCAPCSAGQLGRCERVAFGALQPGLQSGFCADTGGGWSAVMYAHPTQVHVVPDDVSDEDAVMVEPAACAVHAALSAGSLNGGFVVVIGAGTLGLLTVAALRRFNPAQQLLVAAKHPDQRRFARGLGAHDVCDPGELRRAVRRLTGTMAIGDGDVERLAGGCDVVFDCVGKSTSITDALAVLRPGGRIVLVGMAGAVRLDLTPLWHREISLTGAYAYGVEPNAGGRRTFDLAMELAAQDGLGRLVSARYPLDRYEDALAHAANAGRRGATKIAFDLRVERESRRKSRA